jgi:hypothetical protein
MSDILIFDAVTAALPVQLTDYHRHQLPILQSAPVSLADAQQHLQQIINTPDVLAVSAQTPALLWLAAVLRWPQAQFLLYEHNHAPDHWLDIMSGERWQISALPIDSGTRVSTSVVAQMAIAVVTVDQPPIQATARLQTTHDYALKDHELLFEIFRYASYGEDQSEHRAIIESYLVEAASREVRQAGLTRRALNNRALGQHAYALTQQLDAALKNYGNNAAFQAWFDAQVKAATDPKIIKHLQLRLKKALKWHEKCQLRGRTPLQPVSIQSPDVSQSAHPNSLRQLPAHNHWHILIDETGEDFEHPEQLRMSDRALGKWVALAIPVGVVTLPSLKHHFHACDESPAVVDAAVQNILSHAVGVLGITCKDPISGRTPRWFSGVHRLIRLIMRLLPIVPDQANSVEVFIEQRGVFGPKADLLAIQQLLESELQGLDPKRFSQLKLHLSFTPKNAHPANGYVDALAYTWGSADDRRLKLARFAGHCFLRPSDGVIERTYAALDADHPLSAADWYQLTTAMSDEPNYSILQGAMAQLGQQVKRDLSLWQRYLAEVQYRLVHKDYSSAALAATLRWLQDYQPKQAVLSPRLRLQWAVAQLATDNHLGRFSPALAQEAWQLSKQLIDEHAAEACHAHLRIAVAATNTFAFKQAYDMGLFWLAQPVGMVGRLNHAKVLSSLGQHSAFMQQHVQAIAYFDQALAQFALLSDPAEAEREAKQTHSYRLIALMDHPQTCPKILRVALEQYVGDNLTDAANRFAHSQTDRFMHHVLVRALWQIADFADARRVYLEQRHHWQRGQGHPWPLIDAWRGCMLINAGWAEEATAYFKSAIVECFDDLNGNTLHWIGTVLLTLSHRLNVGIIDQPLDLSQLQGQLPHAPYQALADLQVCSGDDTTALMRHVTACLPFNFR